MYTDFHISICPCDVSPRLLLLGYDFSRSVDEHYRAHGKWAHTGFMSIYLVELRFIFNISLWANLTIRLSFIISNHAFEYKFRSWYLARDWKYIYYFNTILYQQLQKIVSGSYFKMWPWSYYYQYLIYISCLLREASLGASYLLRTMYFISTSLTGLPASNGSGLLLQYRQK